MLKKTLVLMALCLPHVSHGVLLGGGLSRCEKISRGWRDFVHFFTKAPEFLEYKYPLTAKLSDVFFAVHAVFLGMESQNFPRTFKYDGWESTAKSYGLELVRPAHTLKNMPSVMAIYRKEIHEPVAFYVVWKQANEWDLNPYHQIYVRPSRNSKAWALIKAEEFRDVYLKMYVELSQLLAQSIEDRRLQWKQPRSQ